MIRAFLLPFLCSLNFGSYAASETKIYSVGVLNQQTVIQTAELWNPFLAYLSEKTGAHFVLRIASTVQETDAQTAQGEFDLVYSNHIFSMPIRTQYRVVARWGGADLRGLLVSLRPMRLQDLNGKTIAFPSADAFASTLLTWGKLKQEKIQFKAQYMGSQEASIAALAKGLVDAAGVTPGYAYPYAEKNRLTLHVLYQSEPYPQIPLLAHGKRIPLKLAQQIRSALLDMPNDRAGQKLLKSLNMPPWQVGDDAMYHDTSELYAQWYRVSAAAGNAK